MSAISITSGEEQILSLARELFTEAREAALQRLAFPQKSPPRISPAAMGLLQETLARCGTLFLARNGAWRREGGQRLWERAQPVPLVFTSASFQFLRWLLGVGDRAAQQAPLLPTAALAASGDEVLLVAALSLLSGTPQGRAVAFQPMVRQSALACAGFAADLGAERALDQVPAFDLTPGRWHAFALEGLAELFARTWAESELEKRRETVPARLLGASLAQARVLDALLAAARAPATRGALTFLLEAGKKVLAAQLSPQAYGSALQSRATLRERTEARQASGALLRGLLALSQLDQSHRQVRFTDEGYETAQALVARWQAEGPSPAQWATIEPTLSALGAA